MRKFIYSLFLFSFVATINAQNAVPESLNATTAGTLSVSTTTSQVYGGYAPSNVAAIWVEDSSGKYVKTLLAYGLIRQHNLTNFIASSANNRVDAISGATRTSFGVLNCSWNGTNVSKVLVADGTYTIKMEITDDETTGRLASYTFVKGPNSQTVTPTNVPSFSNISIKWVPLNTGIDAVKLANLYSVYPNPTKSSIFVNGTDIVEIELCTLSGKSIIKTNEQSVNLGKLPKGVYLLQVKTEKGTFFKKIVKE